MNCFSTTICTSPTPYLSSHLRSYLPIQPLFRKFLRRDRICRPYESAQPLAQLNSNPKPAPQIQPRENNIPIRIISTRLTPQQLLLPRQIRIMPPHQITVLFSRQQRNKMDTRPHLFARKFTTDNQHRPHKLIQAPSQQSF